MFQVKSVQQYAGPTKEQYEVVKATYEKTGILTVKDKVTAEWVKPQVRCGGVAWEKPFQDQTDYGNVRQAVSRADIGGASSGGFVPGGVPPEAGGFIGDTYKVRATYVRFASTKQFPKGIAVGGFEVWTRDNFFDEASEYHCVRFDFDIWREEETQLLAYATDGVYVSDAMWKEKEAEANLRRDHQSVTQKDPVGAVAAALGPGLAAALTPLIESINARGLPDDLKTEIEKLRKQNAELLAKVGAK